MQCAAYLHSDVTGPSKNASFNYLLPPLIRDALKVPSHSSLIDTIKQEYKASHRILKSKQNYFTAGQRKHRLGILRSGAWRHYVLYQEAGDVATSVGPNSKF